MRQTCVHLNKVTAGAFAAPKQELAAKEIGEGSCTYQSAKSPLSVLRKSAALPPLGRISHRSKSANAPDRRRKHSGFWLADFVPGIGQDSGYVGIIKLAAHAQGVIREFPKPIAPTIFAVAARTSDAKHSEEWIEI